MILYEKDDNLRTVRAYIMQHPDEDILETLDCYGGPYDLKRTTQEDYINEIKGLDKEEVLKSKFMKVEILFNNDEVEKVRLIEDLTSLMHDHVLLKNESDSQV